jgi:hypothetical protein
MRDSGWTDSRYDITRTHLLDWVDKTNGERTLGEFAGSPFTVEDATGEHHDVDDIATDLEADGLVHAHRTLGGINSLSLTAAGRREVALREERRANKALRRRACAEALLSWIGARVDGGDQAPLIDSMVRTASPYGYFEGDPFGQAEVDAASRQLLDEGLISGQASWGGGVARPSLTTKGRQVIDYHDGSLRSHYEATEGRGHTFISHFGNVSGGQIAVGDQVTQTQHNYAAPDADVLELLDAVRSAVLGLPEGDREAGLAFVDAIQASGPDDVSRGLARKLLDLASKAGDAAVTTATAALIQGWIH